ncbi:MAG: electron transfer flavoprotein subunit alpha/FixB family protein [Bacillota bacterium]|nr:electron transfer flavoprotein subunit alpha/FixB family protein [Bacillota bacterium]
MTKEYNGVFVFAEQKSGEIHRVSYELIAKGRQLADKLEEPVICGVLGPKDMDIQELIQKGADVVYYVEDEMFNSPEEIIYSKNIVKLLEKIKPEICLFGATAFGRSLAPRVASALKTGLTADCTGLEIDEEDGKLIQIRPAFSENILAHIKSSNMPQMSTVRYKEFDEDESNPDLTGKVIREKPYVEKYDLVKVLQELEQQDINISEAKVVVSAGQGLKSKEDFMLIKELADALGGVVGSSRPLVDEGFIQKSHQVGYSGNRVKPKLYIACGISGAPQHLAGMKDSEIILAINTDPSAPIFNIADYGIVGDIYDVVPQLINKIKCTK